MQTTLRKFDPSVMRDGCRSVFLGCDDLAKNKLCASLLAKRGYSRGMIFSRYNDDKFWNKIVTYNVQVDQPVKQLTNLIRNQEKLYERQDYQGQVTTPTYVILDGYDKNVMQDKVVGFLFNNAHLLNIYVSVIMPCYSIQYFEHAEYVFVMPSDDVKYITKVHEAYFSQLIPSYHDFMSYLNGTECLVLDRTVTQVYSAADCLYSLPIHSTSVH